MFSAHSDADENNNYQKLPAQTAQWTIKKVKQSWNSFFKAIKAWKKHPEGFIEMPKPPKYKNKDGEFLLVFTNQQCRIENGLLKFPKMVGLEVEIRLENVDLREVRVIPQGVGYTIEIVYMKEIVDVAEIESHRIMGIDIGLRNIVTIGDSISKEGIAVKGGVLKSINQFFNKEYARLRSISDRQIGCKRLTKREKRLFMKRNRKIKDIMHKLSKSIVKYAKSKDIDTIVIGHNNGWKHSANMGRINNQNFVQIPFSTLIQHIKYKAEEADVQVIIQEESHTSKCSFLDNESFEHHDEYMGKRIKRGIFIYKNGILMHVDLNAVYNMIRKAIPEAFVDGIG
ncbi:MAG: RNA-guided endonuclease InsQ/TnpB family protein, partial [Thermoplasmata archaeon]